MLSLIIHLRKVSKIRALGFLSPPTKKSSIMPPGHQEGYVGYMYLRVSGTVLTNTRTYLQS